MYEKRQILASKTGERVYPMRRPQRAYYRLNQNPFVPSPVIDQIYKGKKNNKIISSEHYRIALGTCICLPDPRIQRFAVGWVAL